MSESVQGRPRLLLITRNLPPLRGGMERLNQQLAIALSAEAELVVIGPSGCRQHLPNGIAVHEVPTSSLMGFLIRATTLAWRLGSGRFDLVIAGSGLTGPSAAVASRRAHAKSMAYVHGLDIVAAHPVYRLVWMPILRRLDAAIANSSSTGDLAMRAGVARGNVAIVNPGTTLPQHPGGDADAFRTRLNLGRGPLLLSVGRLTERKGLAEFVREALPTIVRRYPDAKLVVIGDDALDALRKNSSDPINGLNRALAETGLDDHLIRLGPCDEATLQQAYAAADVHVFPVRYAPGDIEGFGMVAIESAANELPTVAFAIGGVPDAVADGVSGWLLTPGDYDGFAGRVCEVINAGRGSEIRRTARMFAQDFSWPKFGERVREKVRHAIAGEPFNADDDRRGHAVLDLESRKAKAVKIERLLELKPRKMSLRVLEIGSGSGGIAHYFAHHPTIPCKVHAVDVTDSRQVSEGYDFTQVDGTALPFPDDSFDVVITNHVIEHVGEVEAQRHHLQEVNRLLAPAGRAYLAVPNRWMLVEPHYRLALLSWLPQRWRTPYLRWRKRGTEYDCRPLTVSQLEPLLEQVGFSYEQVHGRALRLTYELERPNSLAYRVLFKRAPDTVFRMSRRGFPTLIYLLHPSAKGPA